MITDWMRNTTLGEILNVDDIVRKISVTNVEVALVQRSLEYYDPMYRDSTIIVTKSVEAGAESG